MNLNEGNQWNVSDGDISSWSCWRAGDEKQAFTAGRSLPPDPFLLRHAATHPNKQLSRGGAIRTLICLQPGTLALAAAERERGRGRCQK